MERFMMQQIVAKADVRIPAFSTKTDIEKILFLMKDSDVLLFFLVLENTFLKIRNAKRACKVFVVIFKSIHKYL